jgi:hypothetical protein
MVVSLAAVLLWLVLSYTPSVTLPALSYPRWSGPLLAIAGAAGLMAFLAIQAWLVWATGLFVRPTAGSRSTNPAAESTVAEFNLRLRSELTWTALPIAMTVALALLASGLWFALF